MYVIDVYNVILCTLARTVFEKHTSCQEVCNKILKVLVKIVTSQWKKYFYFHFFLMLDIKGK